MAAVPHDPYPYIATRPIKVNGALAYDVGDPVPVDAIEALGLTVDEDLAARDTPAEEPVDKTPAVKSRPRARDKKADEPAQETTAE
jgi:hypothetical protein